MSTTDHIQPSNPPEQPNAIPAVKIQAPVQELFAGDPRLPKGATKARYWSDGSAIIEYGTALVLIEARVSYSIDCQ